MYVCAVLVFVAHQATNTATRLTRMAVGSTGGVGAWAAELNAFSGRVNAALVALQEWAPGFRKDPVAAAELLAVATAWVCTGGLAASVDSCH